MKPTFAFAAIATLMAAPAFAGENMTLAESFADWDVNGDAKLSDAEFSAWQKASSDSYGSVTVETPDAAVGAAMTDEQ